MSNTKVVNPHIYKKGKILNFKKLNEGKDENLRKYFFSSHSVGLPSIIHSCNNLNQIVGRNWLGIHKLISYFGISKDPSEKFSKNPSSFNKFFKLLREGENKDLEAIKKLLELQDKRLKNLESKIDSLAPKELPISRSEVNDLTEKLKEIDNFLRQILGKE